MPSRNDRLSQALRAVGDPSRLRILCELGLECRPVTDVIDATGLSQTNVSFHLRVLREGGFVRAERRGPFIYYCLSDPKLLRILHDLRDWLADRPTASTGKAMARRNGVSGRSAPARNRI
jgi:DNA-binding transcriptional ArsR family regulator